MHIDRYMVNLFFEIRRNLPHELQRDLKISDTSLVQKLVDLHKKNVDESIKTLIEVFLERAGDEFLHQVVPKKKRFHSNSLMPKKENLLNEQNTTAKTPKNKSKRMYRGVLVED